MSEMFAFATLALVAIVGLLANGRGVDTGATVTRCHHCAIPSFVRRYFAQRRIDRQELTELRRRFDDLTGRHELQTRINGEYRRTNTQKVDALRVLAEDLNRRVGDLEARERQATTIVVYQSQVIERTVERRANRLAVVIGAIIGAILFGGVLWLFVPPGEYLFGGSRFLISDNVHSWAAVSLFSLLGGIVGGGIASRVFTTRVTDENTVRNVEVQERS